MKTSPEYELRLTIKNAKLLNIMKELGYDTAAQLSRDSGVSQGAIGNILNLKEAAYGSDGITLRPVVEQLCNFLGVGPEEIFPEEQLINPLAKNKFVAQLTKENMVALSNDSTTDPSLLLDRMQDMERDVFDDMIESIDMGITQREKEVLIMRFKKGYTLDQASEKLNLCRERIRQIERKALRKIRNPKLSEKVIEAAGELGEHITGKNLDY